MIEQRNDQKGKEEAFARDLPKSITSGKVEHRNNYLNRVYMVSDSKEAVICLELGW